MKHILFQNNERVSRAVQKFGKKMKFPGAGVAEITRKITIFPL